MRVVPVVSRLLHEVEGEHAVPHRLGEAIEREPGAVERLHHTHPPHVGFGQAHARRGREDASIQQPADE